MKKIPKNDIAILIFYKAQLQLHNIFNSTSVNTLTIDASQKRNYKYVIVNTINSGGRNHDFEILINKKKVNVALSKAQNGFVIIENEFMKVGKYSTASGKLWTEIIEHHRRQNAIVSIAVQVDNVRKKLGGNMERQKT